MQVVSSTLRLVPPGVSLDAELLPRLEHALRAQRRAWYLVPDGAARRRRVAALAQRLPLLSPPVGTLRELAVRALTEVGESAAPPADPLLVEVLLARALERTLPDLPQGPGLAGAARRTLAALLADGWSSASLERELARLEERHPAAHHLEALWRALEALCPEVDTALPLRRVLENGLLQGVVPECLLIEGGPLRGELEARLLCDLVERVRAGGGEVHAVCLDLPVTSGPRGRMVRLLRERLDESPAGGPVEAELPSGPRHLALRLFREPAPAASAAGVVRLEAPDPHAVVDRVAREIRALLAAAASPAELLSRGVVVVAPTHAELDLAERALERHGLPVVRPPREAMAQHPGGRFLLALLTLLEQGERAPLECVLELLASDGWAVGAVDGLGRALRVKGAVTAADAVRLVPGERVRARLEGYLALSGQLRGARSAAEYARLVRQAVHPERGERNVVNPLRGAWRRHGMEAALDGHHPTARVRGAAGYARPLRKLDDLLALLDEVARRTGEEPSLADWLSQLRALIRRTQLQIGSVPARGIRLEEPGAIEAAEHVFVLGLTEKTFPRSPRQDPFLPDRLRERLSAGTLLGARLAADEVEADREHFLLTCAAARGTLYLCTPRADTDGREALPSLFLDEVALCLGGGEPIRLPVISQHLTEMVPPPERAASLEELRTSLASALHDERLDDATRTEVARAWDQLHPDGADTPLRAFPGARAEVTSEPGREFLRRRAQRLSASQLQSYGECAFAHFVKSRLEPEAIEEPLFDSLRRGSRVHDWLWEFGARDNGWTDPDPALLRLLAHAPPKSPPSAYSSQRSQAEWQLWLQHAHAFVERELTRLQGMRDKGFWPEFHELAFGRPRDDSDPRSHAEPVQLQFGGETIGFAGSIDRVDVWTDPDDVVWGLALDYKTGKVDHYPKELEQGEELQIPLYLRVLEAFGIRPAGALYASVRDGVLAGVVRAELRDRLGAFDDRKVIWADAQQWEEMRSRADAEVLRRQRAMAAGEIRALPRDLDCGWCRLQGVCRIDLWKERGDA